MNRLFIVMGTLFIMLGLSLNLIPFQIKELLGFDQGLLPLFVVVLPTSLAILYAAAATRGLLESVGVIMALTAWGFVIIGIFLMLLTGNSEFNPFSYAALRLLSGYILLNGVGTLVITIPRRVTA